MRRVGVLLAVLLVTTAIVASAGAQKEQPLRPARWEYRAVEWTNMMKLGGSVADGGGRPEEFAEKALNKLGEDGWELVQAPETGKAGPFYLKRQKK